MKLPRAQGPLAHAVAEMRALIAREKGDDDPANLKLMSGGLIDIEFIAQYLVLRHAHRHPEMLVTSTRDMLTAAARLELLGADEAERLVGAHRLLSDAVQVTQCAIGAAAPAEMPAGVLRRIAWCAGLPDERMFEAALAERRAEVREAFARIVGDAAA